MKMFKKSLIAASVAVAATAAYAGSINTGSVTTFALEGAVAEGTVGIDAAVGTDNTEVSNDILVELTAGADYIENDVIEFIVTGAEISKVAAVDPAVEVSGSGGGANFIDLDSETGKIRFRVQGGNIASNETLTLKNVSVDSSAFTDSTEIKVATRAVSLNSAIGNYDAVAATTVADVDKQFAIEFTEDFDQIIDVNNSREVFAGADDGGIDDAQTAYDTVEVVLTDNGGDYAFSEDTVTHVITGEDFGYAMAFDADEDGELSSGELCGAGSAFVNVGGATVDCTLEGNTLTIEETVAAAGTTTLQFNAPGADSGFAMKPQSFTASVTVSGTSVESNVASNSDAGEWKLNGASVYVPYMPYADGLSQIIYVTNEGSQAGDIEVTGFDDAGNSYGPYDLGQAAANSITKITGALEDALAADGFTSGKLAFTVTVTAPNNSIEVYTGYNAGNDRGLVINSSN